MRERIAVGVDLGTTHSALAWADREGPGIALLPIPQLVARGSLEHRELLPSFLYLPHPSEGAQPLPWDAERTFVVGELARARAAEAPTRVISSAKSWLSHRMLDRRAGVLPVGAPPDVEKISPVEASWRFIEHLAEAWDHAHRAATMAPLAALEVVLTVPASFDPAARELTVEAAVAAGLEDITLLEEPQAALYAWIASRGDAWRRRGGAPEASEGHIEPGDVVLVVDVGGGTTDFSAILAEESDGRLELVRLAVGEHILLGGDNMDLALAHLARTKLEAEGHEIDRARQASLAHSARVAKERLLGEDPPDDVRVGLVSKGSRLVSSALGATLTREEATRTIVEGFFPRVTSAARPASRARVGLQELGLPYASDPAITKHLAAFLVKQARALSGRAAESPEARSPKMLLPTKVLWNGGVLKSPAIRARLLEVLAGFAAEHGAPAPRELVTTDYDGAVARGAAAYALARRGEGLRIRGGTARAYYVGIEGATPAVPGVEAPITALCVAPFGMEEGTEAALPPLELAVVVGEAVRFRFFGSTTRRADAAGALLERWPAGELDELAPIEVTLPAEGREGGELVPVRLASSVTPVGTLLLEAVPLDPVREGERFKIELGVREE